MKPVFVGGTGRSGTTVVGDLLDHHEHIRTSVPIEIKFLANKSGLLQLVFGRDTPDIEKKIALLDLRSRLRRSKRKRQKFKVSHHYQAI
jgi:hypothetical protein